MRKAFSFYKSYHDQLKLLTDNQRLKIFDAICAVQFLESHIDDIKFSDKITNLVWTGIKHSLQTSIDGYMAKAKALGYNDIEPHSKGDKKPLDKGDKIDYVGFIEKFNEAAGKKIRVADDKFKRQLKARLKDGFSIDEIIQAAENCSKDEYHVKNTKHLTPEFITRADKLQKYLNTDGTNKDKEYWKKRFNTDS